MSKNDPMPNVSFQRKDGYLLVDGTWYISAYCPIHGRADPLDDQAHYLIDEEVAWSEAKTPHHAGLIADLRHAPCAREMDRRAAQGYADAETAAARGELARVERLLIQAREANDERLIDRHTRGVQEARQRVKDTAAANAHVT